MKKAIRIATAMATILCLTAMAGAQTVPQLINYQGYLTDSAGDPLATAEYKLTFNIYNSPDGPAAAWGPQAFTGVPVVKGHFNVILGPKDDNNKDIKTAFASNKAYLEITVNDAASPILPRQQILSVPYAMKAQNALYAVHGVPVGTILPFGGNEVPTGFLLCDGTTVARSGYPALFSAIGKTWGEGDGNTTFELPDLRGMFLRGSGINDTQAKAAGGNYNGGDVGYFEQDQMQGHIHRPSETYDTRALSTRLGGPYTFTGGPFHLDYPADARPSTDGTHGTPRTGNETKPASYAVNYIIKY